MIDGVLNEVRRVAAAQYGVADTGRIESVASDIVKLFGGELEGYHRCDTFYHDLEHTIQVIYPFVHIIEGWNASGEKPEISYEYFELGVIAVLLHDTGYIRKKGDDEGTGAKYTFVHIERSLDFSREYLSSGPFSPEEIRSVCNMILCTGVIDRLDDVQFVTKEERVCGYALGTSDFLGQMAADDYPEKLKHLYSEFSEGYEFEGVDKLRKKGAVIFESAEELLGKTPAFYTHVVRQRLVEMGSLDRYINTSGNGRIDYREAVDRNITKIQSFLSFGHNVVG